MQDTNLTSKICRRCFKEKDLIDFHKFTKGYLKTRSICKTCKYLQTVEARRKPEGWCNKVFHNQVKSSKRRGHNPPDYTRFDLYSWTLAQPNWETLYNNWMQSGWQTNLVPSIDRLDDTLPYSFNNIQLMTWKENNDKGRKSRPPKEDKK